MLPIFNPNLNSKPVHQKGLTSLIKKNMEHVRTFLWVQFFSGLPTKSGHSGSKNVQTHVYSPCTSPSLSHSSLMPSYCLLCLNAAPGSASHVYSHVTEVEREERRTERGKKQQGMEEWAVERVRKQEDGGTRTNIDSVLRDEVFEREYN